MIPSTHRLARLALVFAVALTTSLALAPVAGAVPTSQDAAIRAAHFSPTTPGVDVYLSPFAGGKGASKLWLSKVSYGMVSGYQPLTPGIYTVSMRPAGAPASSPPVLTWTLDAKPHAAYTVAGVGAGTAVRGVVVKDNLSSPPPGEGRVRVIQAASRAPVAKISASGGHLISPAVHFASVSGYQTLPVGTWRVNAVSTSSPTVETSAPVTVRNGQVTSILVLDARTSGITLRTVLDSASAGVMPSDAVPAGAGGTATTFVGSANHTGLRVIGGLGGLALIGLVGVVTLVRRTRIDAAPAE